jgi:hypothetical protein
MNPSHPTPNDNAIDALVRDYLLRREADEDPAPLLRRLGVGRRRAPVRLAHWAAAAVAAAAGVLLCVWGLSPGPALASADQLVRAARDALERGGDRLYGVEVSVPPAERGRLPFLAAPREIRLWTRGDRFRLEARAGGRVWAWGRDEAGRVWAAPSPRLGLEYEPHEVPEFIARAAELCTLDLGTLLGQLPRGFELTREPSAGGTAVIRATRRSGFERAPVRAVTLELDESTSMLTRVIVVRRGPHGVPTTTTYTLTGTTDEPDEAYRLAAHLDEGAEVFGPDKPLARQWQMWRVVAMASGMAARPTK